MREVDPDLKKMLFGGYSLVTVNVIYYIPDHRSLLQEFMWQTLDLKPKYPRIKRFLDFWTTEIEAEIKAIELTDNQSLKARSFRRVDEIFGHIR